MQINASFFKSTKFYTILGILCAISMFVGFYFLYQNNTGKSFLSPIARKLGGNSTPATPVKNVQNPITGLMYTDAESASWIDLRPLAVMVNNHVDARPQSGLSSADIVYEMVAEGGITRYLPFFLTNTPEKIGPVRSTREYYLVLVKELGDAMLMHIGYSPQALQAIETWPVRSLSRGGATFWRDNTRNVATEHTAYVNGVDLRKRADELGWSGVGKIDMWKFKDDTTTYAAQKDAKKLTTTFWYPGDYTAIFEYVPETNSYKRFLGYDVKDNPIPHIDNETREQITVSNVIVQFAAEVPIAGDDKNRLTYQLIGSGSGYVLLDGKIINITWSKEKRDERTMFYDQDGKEVLFNRGKFWVQIVPDRNMSQVVVE